MYILFGLIMGTWVYVKLPLLPVVRLQPTFSAWKAVALLALSLGLVYGWDRRQAHEGEELLPESRRLRIRAPWSPEGPWEFPVNGR